MFVQINVYELMYVKSKTYFFLVGYVISLFYIIIKNPFITRQFLIFVNLVIYFRTI